VANEWADCHDAIVALLGEITMFRRVGKAIPEVLVTDCEAIVLMSRGRHGQLGTMLRRERHYPWILVYVPVASNPEDAEEVLGAAWDALVAKFNQNVLLTSTAARSNLESYQTGWETVAGVKCRVLRTPLEVLIATATAYTASEA